MKKLLLLVVLGVVFAPFLHALEDTAANRVAQAERYAKAMEMSTMMGEMAEALAMNFPQAERENFKALMLEYVDHRALERASLEAMVRHFTAEELEALADFYSQPVAKSAMRSQGPYMAEFLPIIEAEMMRALGQFRRAQAEQNRAAPSE